MVSCRISRIEGSGTQRCFARIQIDKGVYQRGCRGRQVGCGNLQIDWCRGIDLAGCVRRIAGEAQAVAVDDIPILIRMKLTVARITDGALIAQAKKATAIDGNIEWITGCGNAALTELLSDSGHLDADAGLKLLPPESELANTSANWV